MAATKPIVRGMRIAWKAVRISLLSRESIAKGYIARPPMSHLRLNAGTINRQNAHMEIYLKMPLEVAVYLLAIGLLVLRSKRSK
jgi:hypothetical protein